MAKKWRHLVPLTAALCAAVALTPVATAAPRCTNVGPNTMQCETNGSAQITTSPQLIDNRGGWPWGGLILGIGGVEW